MNKILRRHNKHLLFLEHGKKCLNNFVHQCDHCFSMGETLLPFFVIEGFEVWVAPNNTCGHQVDVFTQTGTSPFCNSSSFVHGSRLVDAGICSTECNKILVAFKTVDGFNFSEEVSCRNISDTRDTCNDIHLQVLCLSYQRNQSLAKLLQFLIKEEQALSTVGNKGTVGSDSNRFISQFSQLFDRNGDASSSWSFQSQSQLLISSFLESLSMRVLTEKTN